MSNSYYNHTTYPTPNSPGSSAAVRAELEAITDGFDLMPTLTGNGYKVAMVNSTGTALIASSALQALAITASTIDSTPIGATTRAAGNFTTLSVNSSANLGTAVTIGGGTINNTPIGGTTPSSGAFTTVAASSGFTGNLTGNVTGNITGNVIGNLTGNVTGNVTATSGTSQFNNVTINGNLDMDAGSSATIINLSTPTNSGDAANKGYVDTQDALRLLLSGGTMSGNIAMGSNLITGLASPVNSGDATNKAYVDGVAQGLDVKASVRAATTSNITLAGAQTIDGVSVVAGDRVLVKNQSSAAENGVYVAATGAWSRPSDMDAWAEFPGAFFFVEDGTSNDNSGWVCTVAPGGTLGSTSVTFEQFSGAGQITAGTGMTKSGNTLNVNTASSARIVVGADEIDLAATGITAGTYRSLTIDQWGRATGGTNPTTLAGYGITDAYTTTQVDTALTLKLNLTGGTMSGNLAMGSNKITGLADPTNPQEAATKAYTDSILGSATSAAASASAAATSATNAANSATSASGSATAAASSAADAAASYDSFDDRYLGAKTTDPTVDNDGNPLITGALYFNSSAAVMKVYNGSSWIATYIPATGYLPLTGGTMTGDITFAGTQTWPTFNQSTTGNAATATALQTARTINGVSFDGTANITVADATKLPLAGGTLTGDITFAGTQTFPGTQATLVSGTNIKTINGTTVLGSGDLTIQGGISYTRYTANVTVADKAGVIADTSGGSFTVTLPATPADGAQVSIVDGADSWGTNNLTVGRNGSTIEGSASDLTLDISSAAISLIYSGTTWQVYAQVGGTSGSVVTLTGTQTLTNKTINAANNTLTGVALLAANTFTGNQTGGDNSLVQWDFKDTGWVYFNSGTTNALDFTNGSHQRWAPNTGAQTLSITNWPPSGNLGELLIEGVNLGAATITWPTINWIKSDGTTTTTFSSNGVTLQASGTDWVFLWTRDAGTTIYGKVVR